jgi:hypothetical protein
MYKAVKNRRIMIIIIATVLAVSLCGGLALAGKPAPNGGTDEFSPKVQSKVTNAMNMLGQAYIFVSAAEYFNSGAYDGVYYTIDYMAYKAQLDTLGQQFSSCITEYRRGNKTEAQVAQCAMQVKQQAEAIKCAIENAVHEAGRSVGEYKHKATNVLILGYDAFVCSNVFWHLAAAGIPSDIYYDVPLQSINLDAYDVMVFDPEYSWYGQAMHTGVWWLDGGKGAIYGGLAPADDAYLQSYLAAGRIGLVYMEPYFQDPDFYNIPADGAEYCKYGQIPFLKLNFNGSWIEGAITVNVNQASHPVMAGLPSTFDIDSYKQWDRLDIFDDPMITDKQYLASTAAGEAQVISFNYGKGRVVLLGSDDNWYAAGTPAMQRLIQNSTEWTAPHGL